MVAEVKTGDATRGTTTNPPIGNCTLPLIKHPRHILVRGVNWLVVQSSHIEACLR